MLKIKFKYKDKFTHGQWATQSCEVESVDECIKIYGLNDSCVQYQIISVEGRYNI